MPEDLRPANNIARLIHAVDPYEGFPAAAYDDDLQGWGGHEDFWDEMVRESRATKALEVGTWKGRSAAAIGSALRRQFADNYAGDGMECDYCPRCLIERDHAMSDCPGPQPELICVDTWLGATEFYENFDDPTRYKGLALRHGFPQVYFQFLANMRKRDLHRIVFPFAQSSTNALRFLQKKGVQFDLIYIDASHEYDDVKADLKCAWPLLKRGGIMVGDDYCDHWSGVKMAVDVFCGFWGLTMEHRQYPGEKYPSDYWIVRKS